MNIKSQITIDKYIVQIFAIFLNLLARIIGSLIRINHSLDRDFKRIAICKFKGMGSIIQATPFIQALKDKYPEAEIIFVSSIQNKAILNKITLINKCIFIDDSSFISVFIGFPGFILKLLRNKIQLYFDLEIYSNFSSIVTLLSCSTNRIGYYLRSENYRMGIYTHMIFYNMRLPIHEVYLQLARIFLIKDIVYDLYNLKATEPKINLLGVPTNLDQQKYIVVNPNASDLRVERRWTTNGFVEFINKFTDNQKDYQVLLIGSKDEADYVKSIFSQLKNTDNVLNVAGKTSIEELISIISFANLMLTNDTGPMHIGFSTKTPLIALFGPCLPSQYGTNNNSIIIHKNVYCSPCVHEFIMPPCKGDNTCMKRISVDEVYSELQKALNTEIVGQSSSDEIICYGDNSALGIVNRTK